MTIANHMLAGAVISFGFSNPAIAIVISLSSHYAMDALPHFGFKESGYKEALRHGSTYWVVLISAIQLVVTAILLINSGHLFAIMCGLIAVSPDALGTIKYFIFENRNKTAPKWMRFHANKLHARIQKFERPWGIVVDILFSVVATLLLLKIA